MRDRVSGVGSLLGLACAAMMLAACGGDADPARDAAPDTTDTSETSDAVETIDAEDGVADADTGEPAEPWYRRAVMYEIFVRSFQDSDGDGIGDLRGLISRLDYLNDGVPGAGDDLEVDGIWLMPIQPSPSYHGYDVTDYLEVNAELGTLADLDALVAACQARGLEVVLDLVMNHTSNQHPWFVDASNPGSEIRDWYVWRQDDPGWKQPFGDAGVWHRLGAWFYYGVFWSGMPDLNYRTAGVREAMTDVARFWMDRGVAGFRLDAARYLVESADGGLFEQPETHAFWRELRAALTTAGSEAYLVGEVWADLPQITRYYGGGAELHQTFAFDLMSAIESGCERGEASWIRSAIGQRLAVQDEAPWAYTATFLSNHDLDRLALRLSDVQQRAAIAVLMTLPGTPYLYYGDELGARPSPALGDQAKRGPMAWTAEDKAGFTTGTPWLALAAESDVRNVASALADPTSLLSLHRELIRLRRAHPALSGDGLTLVTAAEASLLVMVRADGDEILLVAVNLDDAAIETGDLDLGSISERLPPLPATAELIYTSEHMPSANLEIEDWASFPSAGGWTAAELRVWRFDR